MAKLDLGRAGRFDDDTRLIVRVGDLEVGVLRFDSRFHAFSNYCLHQGGPICEGILIGKVESELGPDMEDRGRSFSEDRIHLVCPWHAWEYDLETGECAADRRLRLRKFEVVEEDEHVFLIV